MLINLTIFTASIYEREPHYEFLEDSGSPHILICKCGSSCVQVQDTWKRLSLGPSRMRHAPYEAGTMSRNVLFRKCSVQVRGCPLFLKMFVVKILWHMVSHFHMTIAWYWLPSQTKIHRSSTWHHKSTTLSQEAENVLAPISQKSEAQNAESLPQGHPGTKKGDLRFLVTVLSSTESPAVHLE